MKIKGNNNNKNIINFDDIPIKSNITKVQNLKNENNIKKINKKETPINNFSDTPLPINSNPNVLNVDSIEIKGTNDFNALLEKELAKGNYNANPSSNPTQPRFKYIPKPKNEEKYKITAPTTTKKYKYYSDNFKNNKKSKENDLNKNEMMY